MLGVEIDVGVGAGEAGQEPFLGLALKPPAPQHGDELRRQVVVQPAARLGDDLGLVGADLLAQLAQCRHGRRLARIDAALRHLPGLARHVDAPGDQNPAVAVEQHDPDAAAIAVLGVGRRRGHIHHLASALTGTATMPFSGRPASHAASRSTVTG